MRIRWYDKITIVFLFCSVLILILLLQYLIWEIAPTIMAKIRFKRRFYKSNKSSLVFVTEYVKINGTVWLDMWSRCVAGIEAEVSQELDMTERATDHAGVKSSKMCPISECHVYIYYIVSVCTNKWYRICSISFCIF